MDSVTLSFIAAGYLTAANNETFWSRSLELLSTSALFTLVAGVFCLLLALCITVSAKYIVKPIFIALILISASASWFVDQFGTIIDVEMLQSVVDTTNAEAGHLINFPFLIHIAIFGIIPVCLIAWIKLDHRPILSKIRQNSAFIFPALLIAIALFISQASTFTSLGREHREWISTLNPLMPIGNAVKLALRSSRSKNVVVRPIGLDATVYDGYESGRKPRVLIIVAGETARAESFSLGGYQKETNPELKREDITYFSNTTSCGTITAVSLPCMFSKYTQSEYSHQKGIETENLLDVLKHAGVNVEWWDNNTGHKGIAERVDNQQFSSSGDPEYCRNGECRDEIFLEKTDKWLEGVKQDSVLVLHQLGSHGPAYYLRYPDEFRRFTPDCQTSDFSKCTKEEITNSYDNTIAYTDHVLAALIRKLRQHEDTLDTSFIYVSDHGESIGEFGLYLHGAPYFIAPSQQTHVPYLIWLGPEAKSAVDDSCLAREASSKQTHDNLFHTVLGLMNVNTSVYSRDLDTLSACRGTPLS